MMGYRMKHTCTTGKIVRGSVLLAMALHSLQTAAMEQDQIGRLFTTPRERAALDQARQSNSKTVAEANSPVEEKLGDQITLDGFVRKNNGKTTVWVNQVPQTGHENAQGITIIQSGHSPSAISMQLPSGKSIRLKAGQTFDTTNGKVMDVYDDTNSVISKAGKDNKK
jgi:hypothetical protein